MAMDVMDGPKIAMSGSACPGGFEFIKLVTSGLVAIRRPNSSIPCGVGEGGRKGRENCETRLAQWLPKQRHKGSIGTLSSLHGC